MSQIWKTSRAWFLRLGGLFHKARRDAELAAELESHLQLHIDDNLRAGMTKEAARRDGLMRLGGLDQAKERYRDRRGLPLLETTLQDCRYAVRLLRKNAGFTLVAIVTLALGIGASTAVFSVMNTVLLRALPVPDPAQLVYLRLPNWQPAGAFSTGDSETSFSEPVFEQLRKEPGVFQDLMAYAPLLVATGLYGTLAYRVSQRTSEIGVRMALGAQRSRVLWMVLGESLVISAAGIGVGTPLAFAGARLMRSMLFGLGPTDALSFVAALLGITLVTALAGVIPTRRAATIDPITALRYE